MTIITHKPGSLPKLICEDLERKRVNAHTWELVFHTNDGDMQARYHPVEADAAIGGAVWVGGTGGGLDGPARGLYAEACLRLQQLGVAGLRVAYRYPGYIEECIRDTLLGIEFLGDEQIRKTALIGHSFGGAVVITTGALSQAVKAVVAMATQSSGVELASELSPRSLLLIHGMRDEVLSHQCSTYVYHQAKEPKDLRLFEQARHGLDEAREEILQLLCSWIPEQLEDAR